MRRAVLNYLHSGHLFCTDEEDIKHKFVFLNSVISFTIIITIAMGSYRYLNDNEIVSTIDFGFALVSTLLLFLLRRDKSYLERIATLLLAAACLLFITLFLYATVQSTRISVFFLLVASAFYLKGTHIGKFWLLAVMSAIGLIHFGRVVPTGYSDLDIIVIYIYLVSFYIILRLYETVKMSHTESLINLNTNLETLVHQRTEELHREKERLKIVSTTDPLTRLNNRHKMDEVFEYEARKTEKEGGTLSIILLDIDHFKKVNDVYGHNVGDTFLQEIAGVLQDTFREHDTIGRWGGEEFLVFLPNTRLNGARRLAERLRETVAKTPFSHIGKQSISLGIAVYERGESMKSLIHRADNALYRAKKQGRNRVESAPNTQGKDDRKRP
jgi:diguanylate cyclase (GGDEF)-like protein